MDSVVLTRTCHRQNCLIFLSSCSPQNDGLPLATIVTTAKHKDDFGVDVIVQAKCVLFEGDTTLLCLWIKRDFGEDHAAAATSPCPSLDDSKVERVCTSCTLSCF